MTISVTEQLSEAADSSVFASQHASTSRAIDLKRTASEGCFHPESTLHDTSSSLSNPHLELMDDSESEFEDEDAAADVRP